MKYIIAYRGKVKEGKETQEVKENLKECFKLKESTLEKYFSGKVCIVKKDVAYKTAIKIKSAFEKAGALCKVMTYEDEIPKPPKDIDFEDTSKIPLKLESSVEACPKCGLEQEGTNECARCGILFDKVKGEKTPRVFNWKEW